MASLYFAPSESRDDWLSDAPDLADLVAVSERHHPPNDRDHFAHLLGRLDEARTELGRVLATISPPVGQEIRQITERGTVLPPPLLWELDAGVSLLREFETTSRFDVCDPDEAHDLREELWSPDLEFEHVAALAAYFCEQDTTNVLRAVCTLTEAGELEVNNWELLDGIRDAERCLNALDTWCRRALQSSAEAALVRIRALQAEAEVALSQTRDLVEKEERRHQKMRDNGVSARAKHTPGNKHQTIREAWAKLTTEGEPERQIAAKVAQRCGCSTAYARRIARTAKPRTP